MSNGEKIKNIRTTHKMTQEQLSAISGISLHSIRKYESGERNPKPEQLLKIAEALGISINLFMDFDIRTVSDLLSLIFRMDEQVDMKIVADTDAEGNYLPDTLYLTFSNDTVNEKLCGYLSVLRSREELKQSKSKLSETEFREKLDTINQNITRYIDLLLDDDTPLCSSTVDTDQLSGKSGDKDRPSVAAIPDAAANLSINRQIQELFLDCDLEEAKFLINSLASIKENFRKLQKS